MGVLLAIVGIAATDTNEATKTPRREVKKETCKSAERAIVFYRNRTWFYQDKLDQKRLSTYFPERRKNACDYKRFVVTSWRGLAFAYRQEYKEWRDHWAWWEWMPSSWQDRSRCELGYSLQQKSWRSNVFTSNGNFQGFVNFYNGTWDGYKMPDFPSEAYNATPRQQYLVALAVANAVGLGAWQSCA